MLPIDEDALRIDFEPLVLLMAAHTHFKNLLMRFKAYVLYKMVGDFVCSFSNGEE